MQLFKVPLDFNQNKTNIVNLFPLRAVYERGRQEWKWKGSKEIKGTEGKGKEGQPPNSGDVQVFCIV